MENRNKCTTRGGVIYRIMFATQSSKTGKFCSPPPQGAGPTCWSWDRFPNLGSYYLSTEIDMLLMISTQSE